MYTINKAAVMFGTALALGVTSSAWADIALENPLGDSYYANGAFTPRIDMSNINLSYTGWRPHQSNVLSGVSAASTALTLIDPSMSATPFDGTFKMRAYVTPKGELTGGKFSFTSSDPMFGFGSTCTGSVCTAKTGTVFKGKLDSIGWSESKGSLEFGTSNFSGWACAQGWCTSAERLFFTMNNGSLGLTPGMKIFKSWHNTASGTAVIPVPAAAWLFGSGLVGLIGFAKRSKKI